MMIYELNKYILPKRYLNLFYSVNVFIVSIYKYLFQNFFLISGIIFYYCQNLSLNDLLILLVLFVVRITKLLRINGVNCCFYLQTLFKNIISRGGSVVQI